MSKYEWESGSIRIPTREMPKLKKTVLNAALAYREKVLEQANRAQDRLAQKLKGARGLNSFEFDSAFRDVCGQLRVDDCMFWEVESLISKSKKKNSLTTFNKITEKMVTEVLGKKPNSRTVSYDIGEASFGFNGSEVFWDVPENNHAVDRAHEHPLAEALFRALGRINYGKNKRMGGVLVGNDEYNRDADWVGGGGNYVTSRFGPAGEAQSPYGF